MLRLFNTHLTKTHSPDTETSQSHTIQSPTKGGIMRPDKHWILKTPRGAGFEHPYRPNCSAHPVTTDPVNFDLWQKAHFVSKVCEGNQCEDRMLGRRCNDEVELFFQEDEEEYGSLKECLEEVGLSVRAFVLQREKKVRSKRKGATVLGEGAKRMGMCVQEMEFENEVKVAYGLVVEVVGVKRAMVVLRVDEEMFHGVKETGKMQEEGIVIQTSDGPKELGRVLGGIRNTTDLWFWVLDEVAKEFFDGMGFSKEAPEFTDFVEKKAREEAEQKKKEKKAAKKHRRMMTESTTSASATTPSELSFGSPMAEQEEAVKARQRAKQNEKRKKQHQRRREEQAAELAEEEKRQAKLTNRGATITLKSLSDSEDSTSDSSSGSSNWQLGGRVSNFDVYSNHKGYLQFRPIELGSAHEEAARKEKEMGRHEAEAKAQVQAKVEEVDVESDEEAKKPKVKLPQPLAKKQKLRKDSVKDSSDEEEDNELPIKEVDEAVYVTTVEEVRPYLERGGNIWVAGPDGVREVSMGRGLQYLGRGL